MSDKEVIPTVVDPDPQANIADLLRARVEKSPNAPLFAVPEGDSWRDITAAEFERDVIAVAKGLVAAGVEPGDHVSLMSRVRYEWSVIDFAIHYAGAIMVPVYETSAPSQMEWIMTDGGTQWVLLENDELLGRYNEIPEESLAKISRAPWVLDAGGINELKAAGADVEDSVIDERRARAVGADIGTIIYTSGSTAKPKGVVLTQSNFVDLSRNAAEHMAEVVAPGASTLLFVTLAHVFARFISVLAVEAGVKVGHQPDTTKLVDSLGTFKPTFLLAVPRVFEKVYNGAEAKAIASGKGRIFGAAAKTAIDYSTALADGKVPLTLSLKHKLFDRLVYGTLREAMGGQVKWAVSGGAPLGARLSHFFRGIGVTVLEGYGLTETTAPICVNLPWDVRPGTVGPPLPGSSVAIDDSGELLVKGVMVFKGYHNNPEATAESLKDGWFHTGDLGSLADDGSITITGRRKEVIVTAGGKNVSPAQLEDQLRSHPLVSQCVVIGDQKPFVAAILTLDAEMLGTWLKNNGLPEMTVAEAAQNEAVRTELQTVVESANQSVSRAESIRAFEVIDSDFTEENGYLTPSLKLKRNVVVKDLAPVIEKIYSGSKPTG